MQKWPEQLPENLKTFVLNLPFPGSKYIAVVYDAQGNILYHSMSATYPFVENVIAQRRLKITDVLHVFDGADSEEFHRQLFRPTLNEQLNGLIRARFEDGPAGVSGFVQSLPAQIKVSEFEGYFVAGVHPINYFVDRAMSRTSPNMLVILDDHKDIVFFSERFWGALDGTLGSGPVKMESLTDARQWQKLASREGELRRLFDEASDSNPAPWREILSAEVSDAAQWISQPDAPWTLGHGAFQVDPEVNNSFVTLLPEVNHLHHDLRVEMTADFTRLTSVGVVFNGDIYRSDAAYLSPDGEGYNFAFTHPPGESRVYLRLKKGGRIVEERWMDWDAVTEKMTDLSAVRIVFEKTAGLFTLSVGQGFSAKMYDIEPILATPHHFLAFLGGPRTRFWDVKILSRRTRFEHKKIPTETIDIQLYRMPQFLFETKIFPIQLLGKNFSCVYLNDVTQNRRLLRELNKYVREIEEDLQTAKRIQALLTDLKPPKNDQVQFVFHYQSSGHVGGDMLDVKDLGQGQWAILIYDVSGHGVAASLICAMAKMSFDNAFKRSRSPAEVARMVNEDICAVTEPTVFLTAFVCVLDIARQSLVYTRAGHCPPLLFPAGGGVPNALEAGDSVIGYLQDFVFSEHRVALSAGDRILLYTDGLIEARNANRQFLGKQRVVEVIRANRGKSVEQVKQEILRLTSTFTGGNTFDDDLAIILMEIGARP